VSEYFDIFGNCSLLLVDKDPSAVLRQRELLKVLYRLILIGFVRTISHIIKIIIFPIIAIIHQGRKTPSLKN